ncbi:SH2 domain [Popillia japonica]|uniref:SH2 domain n=1 Tax=Popillia japonica TaxID=7064 RepID=A0AAW1KL23_POPJA
MDGEPWVWVMGEHENDKSIQEILRDEAIEKARKLAEKEAEELRKQVEAKITMELIELTPKIQDLDEMTSKLNIEEVQDGGDDDGTGIYCSVDELREKMSKPIKNMNNYTICHYQSKNKLNNIIIDRRTNVLQELSINKNKVAQRIALWEKRLTEERTCEIFNNIQKKQMEVAKEAEEAEKRQEQLWIEQEKKAKQAEKQIREIARRAREEHRLSSNNMEIDTSYCNATMPGVPPGRQAVIDWFKAKEITRNATVDSVKRMQQPWFHGLITRKEAESLLMDQPDGSFLVRLSEKIWGYAISYRAKEKCDLISHHRQFPLSGGEKLQNVCPRKEERTIDELFDN